MSDLNLMNMSFINAVFFIIFNSVLYPYFANGNGLFLEAVSCQSVDLFYIIEIIHFIMTEGAIPWIG